MEQIIISIIIICKNEELNIKRCLKSIKQERLMVTYEILLIDSCSTDNTVNIAKRFENIKIYILNPKWHHNAAIGRYVGSKLAKGKYLLFMDGDMELGKECNFTKAIEIMEAYENVIALSGILEEYIYNEKQEIIGHTQDRYRVKKLEERLDLGGVFLIKKDLLEQVGNMDITLDSEEDLDLNYRFKYMGYKLYRTPELKFIHHTKDYNSFRVLNSRFKDKRHRDLWLVTIRSAKYKCLYKHVYANRGVFMWIFTLVFTLICTMLLLFKLAKPLILICVVIVDCSLCIYKIVKNKKLKLVLMDFYHALLCLLSIFQTNSNKNMKIDLRDIQNNNQS